MIHKVRGRNSNNQLIVGIREYVIELVRSRYAEWMVEDGLWLSRKQRRSFHQPCLRRESFPQSLEITKCSDFAHSHRTTTGTDRMANALSRPESGGLLQTDERERAFDHLYLKSPVIQNY
jgi:hypothetical protein